MLQTYTYPEFAYRRSDEQRDGRAGATRWSSSAPARSA